MVPSWLIEANVFGDSFEPLKVEIRQQGMAWDVVQPGPFLNGLTPTVRGYRLKDRDCVIFSGTYPLMRHLQLNYHWVPGGWCTAENFDCSRYYPHFGRYLLNQDHTVLPLQEALNQLDALFGRFAQEGRVFFRPCGVQKTFTGRCADPDAFTLALESARYAGGSILVAPPRRIDREWRVVIGRGRFLAGSQYRLGNRLHVVAGCPAEVRQFVETVLAAVPYRPDPLFILDVCACGGQLYVLELNSFSCSGFYQCDPAVIVQEVKHLALEAWHGAE
jgi:hypothetical protein